MEENMMLKGFRGASIPDALEKKYPNAPMELAWQYIFPAGKPAIDPRSGFLKQHYRHESYLQKAVKSTMIYTHVLNRNKFNVQSPLDSIRRLSEDL